MTFEHPAVFEQNEYWRAWLYNDATDEISVYFFLGTDTSVTTYSVGLSAGTYYLRITGGDYYSDNSHRFSSETYIFKVNFTETEYAERENNDSFATATAAKLRKTYSGSINDSADVDYYKLSLSKAGTITIKFTTPNLEKNEEYWVVKIYDKDNKELDSFSVTGTETETLLGGYSYPAGEYYIRVTGGAFGRYGSNRFSTKPMGLISPTSIWCMYTTGKKRLLRPARSAGLSGFTAPAAKA